MKNHTIKHLKRTKSSTNALVISVLFGLFGFLYMEEMKKFWTWITIIFFAGVLSLTFKTYEPLVIFWVLSWGFAVHDSIELE